MEEQILFIQYQVWAVIALLVIFVSGNLLCYLTRNTKSSDEFPEFGAQWDKGEIDELLKDTESYLEEFPNYSSALYFRAKALIARKRYTEAKKHLNMLLLNHPEYKENVTELLEVVENENS